MCFHYKNPSERVRWIMLHLLFDVLHNCISEAEKYETIYSPNLADVFIQQQRSLKLRQLSSTAN